MKQVALVLSVMVFVLGACRVTGTVTPPAPDLPVNTELPVATQAPLDTEVPVIAEVPSMGSTRMSEADGMTLVFVPGGEFTMGSDVSGYANERPVHSVFLESYWIDQTEVTNAMFGAFVAQAGYQTDAERAGSSRGYNTNTGKGERTEGADWEHPLARFRPVGSRRASGGACLVERCASLLSVGRAPPADRGRMGESRPGHRRQDLSLGQ